MAHDASSADAQFSLGFAAPAARESLFFAVLPDAATAQRMFALGERVRAAHGLRGPGLPVERLHLTLHYLGEYAGMPPRLLQQAHAVGQALAAAPFELCFDRVLSFGGRGRARPLVLHGDGEPPALRGLRDALQQRLLHQGVATRAEAAYVPHITLAYDALAVPLQAVPQVRWTVAAVSLIRSVQGQGRYLHEATWPLSAAAADAAHAGDAASG
ncbi:2'-5' RNA ligase family protein [Xanthomonas translucens]|uniref:2'-5' RNA ligase family protein n=1 Tax=Xanthomonas campestris pv. translucens TaxID=343 RepID=UPI0006423E35|nr:2'-5' RNA ligase family protein [Xanthomonas translucens]AKK67096.1 2'-5' RNA ligase [Xanthomonas translucens pv. undulosa]AVY67493.1 2'-5' RNA ligase [Xanthomonas translucens pv. undulosa]MBC3971665.1 2'-5' RNA ligase family protein [Xanthomonas translucens pv. undulosa]MCT8269490.1 2'-5' RNA ligase family protein [Xanthomonas translucens pv. undulosa]QEN93010.1 RNA 2',3'-cyclic phosphodiesterase [Xanthomonas translucens pv. undulosa]